MLLRLLVQYLRPHALLIWGVGLCQILQSIASLYLPTLNAAIIDQGVAIGDTGYILSAGALMLGITVLQVACAIAAVYFGARLAMGLGRDLRASVFHQVGGFSEREVTTFGAASLITRTTNDVQQVQMLVLMICTLLVSAPILAIGGVVLALQQDLQLSWIMAVSIPLLVIAVGLVIWRMIPQYRLMQTRIDTINRVLREQLAGIRVVRAFVREDVETKRFRQANDDVTTTGYRVGRLNAVLFPIVGLILNISSVAVIWFGSFRVGDGSMQIGTLTAFLQYLMQILIAVMMATFMAIMIPRASVSADRIAEVLDTESSVVPPADPVKELVEHGTIELRDVGFAYPGAERPVLVDIRFSVPAGRTTAIIGSTGAGKTTLVNLLPRLFDATSGTVLVDGVDVARLDPELLRSRIGLVPQKPYLFSGTIASNLRYGKPNATESELWNALDIAQAADFVREMADGLESAIAQGGINLSGGQRQRIAIARAVVKRPEIYVFDDASSALDLTTDARLRFALDQALPDATKVIVAQRISTIVHADQIVVLEDGRVVGLGTHEELVQSSPTYFEIVQSQFADEAAA